MHCAIEPCERGPFRFSRPYDGYSGQAIGWDEISQPTEILVEHLRVHEQQGAQRLALRGGAHAGLRGEMREECADRHPSHLMRVALVVEQHEASYPLDEGLLGAATIVPHTDGFSEPVEQPRRWSADSPDEWTAFAHPAPEPTCGGRQRRTA